MQPVKKWKYWTKIWFVLCRNKTFARHSPSTCPFDFVEREKSQIPKNSEYRLTHTDTHTITPTHTQIDTHNTITPKDTSKLTHTLTHHYSHTHTQTDTHLNWRTLHLHTVQSWALAVILLFFLISEKIFFAFFIKLIWLGVGFQIVLEQK